ncbi:hypothetical protein BgiMline_010330 [Biomphalaria glabrata]|nr:hypothetical protein BgiMline_024066 [Biomphalaria glabrata]
MQQHNLTSARAPLLNLDSCLKNTGNVRGIIVNSHIDDVTGQPHRARRQAWVEGTKKVSWQWTEVDDDDDDDDDDDKNNNSVSKFHLVDDALPNRSVLRDSKSLSEASDDGDETMTLKEQSSVEDDHFTAVRNTTSYSGSTAAPFKSQILSPTWLPFSEDPEHRLECVRCQYYHSRFVQEKILNYASLSAKRSSLKTFSAIHNSADAEVPSVDCSTAKLKQTHDLHSVLKSVDKKAKSQHVSKDYFGSAASRDKRVQFFVGDQNVQVLNSHVGIIDEKGEYIESFDYC